MDNAWNPDAPTNADYRALKDRYLETLAVFHQYAPNARVSLGWGGWQTRWDDPSIWGRALDVPVLRRCDARIGLPELSSDGERQQCRRRPRDGRHARQDDGPAMLAHYKPNNRSQATFERDICALLTEQNRRNNLAAAGLFAWASMDDTNLSASEDIFRFTQAAVGRLGGEPASWPLHKAVGGEAGVTSTNDSC